MIDPKDVGKMTDVVWVELSGGGRIEVRAPATEVRWLRALFLRNPCPFKSLRDIGLEPVPPRPPKNPDSGAQPEHSREPLAPLFSNPTVSPENPGSGMKRKET